MMIAIRVHAMKTVRKNTKKNQMKQLQRQAEIMQAFSHPIRIAIAEVLRDGEVCVCHIAQRVGAERSNVSRHLAIMLRTGVLQTRREGLQIFYSLRTPCMLKAIDAAGKAAQQISRENAKAFA